MPVYSAPPEDGVTVRLIPEKQDKKDDKKDDDLELALVLFLQKLIVYLISKPNKAIKWRDYCINDR